MSLCLEHPCLEGGSNAGKKVWVSSGVIGTRCIQVLETVRNECRDLNNLDLIWIHSKSLFFVVTFTVGLDQKTFFGNIEMK